MINVIALLPKRSDLSDAAFATHLRETHLPLVAALPGLRKLTANWVLPDPNGPEPGFAAVTEDWFDDPTALQAALASPQAAAVGADAANVLDLSGFQLLVVHEEPIVAETGAA